MRTKRWLINCKKRSMIYRMRYRLTNKSWKWWKKLGSKSKLNIGRRWVAVKLTKWLFAVLELIVYKLKLRSLSWRVKSEIFRETTICRRESWRRTTTGLTASSLCSHVSISSSGITTIYNDIFNSRSLKEPDKPAMLALRLAKQRSPFQLSSSKEWVLQESM